MAPYDQISDAEIRADAYGLNLSSSDTQRLWVIFEAAEISQYFHNHPVAIARDSDGEIIAGITGQDSLSIAVHPERQQEGIATDMIQALLADGGGGFMTAGTEAGANFLFSLPDRLGEYPENLDVPSWEGHLAEYGSG